MIVPLTDAQASEFHPLLELNRTMLRDADVYCVSLIGGPGCGKTRLINATLDPLDPTIRVGVIACDISSKRDSERIAFHTHNVVQVIVGNQGIADPIGAHRGLSQLDLKELDLVLIENVGSLDEIRPPRLGQDATVTMFSVAAGDDKPEKHPDLVRGADAIVLNKVDLISAVPFNLRKYRQDMKRLNPHADQMELSALNGEGINVWTYWLKQAVRGECDFALEWFV